MLRAVAGRDPLGLDRWAGRRSISERPASQRFPAVRGQPAGQVRPLGHDPGGIDVGVHDVVVLLDLDEVDGIAETRRLEQVTRVGPQHRHLGQFASIALEMPVVHRIEAGQRGEQPHVCLGDGVSHQVSLHRSGDRSPNPTR